MERHVLRRKVDNLISKCRDLHRVVWTPDLNTGECRPWINMPDTFIEPEGIGRTRNANRVRAQGG
jgi:hypothetical protein